MRKYFGPVAALALGLLSLAAVMPAEATPIYTYDLNVDGCTGGCGLSHYGIVELTQVDLDTVRVKVTLDPGVIFAKSGAGDALEFNISGNPAITIDGITSGFKPGPAPDSASYFGDFMYSVTCDTGCGNGTSSPQNPGPLQFDVSTVAALTPLDFITNTSNNGDFYFASDIGAPNATGGFYTGNVGTDSVRIVEECTPGVDCVTQVPEPSSLPMMLFGALGLFGFVAMSRRKSRATN